MITNILLAPVLLQETRMGADWVALLLLVVGTGVIVVGSPTPSNADEELDFEKLRFLANRTVGQVEIVAFLVLTGLAVRPMWRAVRGGGEDQGGSTENNSSWYCGKCRGSNCRLSTRSNIC